MAKDNERERLPYIQIDSDLQTIMREVETKPRAMSRLLETQETTVKGGGLPEIQELLEAERPEGFDLTVAPVAMKSDATELTSVGTFARRD